MERTTIQITIQVEEGEKTKHDVDFDAKDWASLTKAEQDAAIESMVSGLVNTWWEVAER